MADLSTSSDAISIDVSRALYEDDSMDAGEVSTVKLIVWSPVPLYAAVSVISVCVWLQAVL